MSGTLHSLWPNAWMRFGCGILGGMCRICSKIVGFYMKSYIFHNISYPSHLQSPHWRNHRCSQWFFMLFDRNATKSQIIPITCSHLLEMYQNTVVFDCFLWRRDQIWPDPLDEFWTSFGRVLDEFCTCRWLPMLDRGMS